MERGGDRHRSSSAAKCIIAVGQSTDKGGWAWARSRAPAPTRQQRQRQAQSKQQEPDEWVRAAVGLLSPAVRLLTVRGCCLSPTRKRGCLSAVLSAAVFICCCLPGPKGKTGRSRTDQGRGTPEVEIGVEVVEVVMMATPVVIVMATVATAATGKKPAFTSRSNAVPAVLIHTHIHTPATSRTPSVPVSPRVSWTDDDVSHRRQGRKTQDARCKMQNAKCKMQIQNANYKTQNKQNETLKTLKVKILCRILASGRRDRDLGSEHEDKT